MAVSVSCKNVIKHFGTVRAIDDITITVNPGEIFFLLGPSGCGKTTLLRSIAGFNKIDSGAIFIGDTDVTGVSPYKRDTGMVFQSYALWPHMTVEENVAFGLEIRHLPKEDSKKKVMRALSIVHMEDRAKYKPNQLSGGQQQRVALARALVIEPKCLLLDEPLSNLDAKLRLEMRTEIRRICKEIGLTAIYVTHDQKEALSIADRLAILEGGKVRQIGTPMEVYLRPQNKFVAGFIGEANFIDGTITEIGASKITVSTPIGLITALRENLTDETKAAVGSNVTLSIRPESVKIAQYKNNTENSVSAILKDFSYQGDVAQYAMELSGNNGSFFSINAVELGTRTRSHISAGDSMAVSVDSAEVIVL